MTMTMAEKMAQERSLLNQLALDRLTKATVGILAEHYKFDAEEALRLLGAQPPKTAAADKEAKKRRAPLPWREGVVRGGDMCQALDYKGGLFTQCEARAQGSSQWCAKCARHGQKYGTVAQRVAQGEAFADSKGRPPACYASVLATAGFTREDAQSEASARGQPPLPDTVFVPRAKKPRAKKAPAPVLAPTGLPDLNTVLDEALADPDPVPTPVPVVPAQISETVVAPVPTPVPVVVAPVAAKPKATKPKVDPRKPVAWEFRGTKYGKNAVNEVFAVLADGKFGEARLGVYNDVSKDLDLDPNEDSENEDVEDEDEDEAEDRC